MYNFIKEYDGKDDFDNFELRNNVKNLMQIGHLNLLKPPEQTKKYLRTQNCEKSNSYTVSSLGTKECIIKYLCAQSFRLVFGV